VRAGKAHGFALIDLIFVCGIIGLLAGIALPGMLRARQSASSASALGSLRSINSGQLTYALTCGNGFYAPNLPRLGVAPPGSQEPFLSPNLTTADTVLLKGGYQLTVSGTAFAGAPATCNGLAPGEAAQGFRSGADPVDSTNTRFFGSNASGSIYEDVATLFAAMPEVGEPPSGHVVR
jgi:type II secretory pathway pseudopilin PulG